MRENKSALAKETGVSRSTLYYKPKQITKDWNTKQLIEETLHIHPSYGHKRLALALHLNKKRILRVMHIFGIKPYRRYAKKRFVVKTKDSVYPNLLIHDTPRCIGDIWASDFTYIKYHGYWVYVGTIIDVYSREIVGVSVLTTHSTQLIMNALMSAIHHRPPPRIIHSDQGSEYASHDYTSLVQTVGIIQSMSRPGCPWENGYQESFYKGFKLDLGDPNRFETLGELVAEIYSTLHYYNTSRIHSALHMAPTQFASLQGI